MSDVKCAYYLNKFESCLFIRKVVTFQVIKELLEYLNQVSISKFSYLQDSDLICIHESRLVCFIPWNKDITPNSFEYTQFLYPRSGILSFPIIIQLSQNQLERFLNINITKNHIAPVISPEYPLTFSQKWNFWTLGQTFFLLVPIKGSNFQEIFIKPD